MKSNRKFMAHFRGFDIYKFSDEYSSTGYTYLANDKETKLWSNEGYPDYEDLIADISSGDFSCDSTDDDWSDLI
jgi:predicted lipoprotein with Yx(FWY)xxD motif